MIKIEPDKTPVSNLLQKALGEGVNELNYTTVQKRIMDEKYILKIKSNKTELSNVIQVLEHELKVLDYVCERFLEEYPDQAESELFKFHTDEYNKVNRLLRIANACYSN